MSIKLQFQKGSYVTRVALKDEALKAIHELISTYQTDDADQPRPDPSLTDIPIADLPDLNKQPARINEARSWLSQHSAAEALSRAGWQTFPERILVFGAHYD